MSLLITIPSVLRSMRVLVKCFCPAIELPPNEPSETVSASASPENDAKVKAVEVDQQANDSALKIEMKMMETALQGAARQAQVLNDATILFKDKLASQLLDRCRTSCTWRLGVVNRGGEDLKRIFRQANMQISGPFY
ncbi:hypothetical protein ACOSP7_020449 [Xanthoceras sorbifolium]